MKPKEFLDKLEEEMLKASADTKDIHTAAYAGAKEMWRLCRKKQNEYRKEHRAEIRAYNTQYQRERRAKAKERKEDIDRIADMQ